MRALKLTFALAGLLVLVQYLDVYYNSVQFNDFVQQQARQTRLKGQLKSVLLNRAKDYSLPVTEADINITTSDGVFRVAVNYRVPLNLLVYYPELKFRAMGAGFTARQ